MKAQKEIPVSKVARATRFASTGLKIGGNVIKHYARKTTNPRLTKDRLHEENAEDIYDLLSTLKGGALKVAQMLSMDQNLLPTAYNKKFELSQFSAPPLSHALVRKTFRKYQGKQPEDLFDEFSENARNAASIGQVHEAKIGSRKLAVKVQYPGVKDSLKSDLAIAKPLASKIMNVPLKDLDVYIKEVEEKLVEETNYELELLRGIDLTSKTTELEGIIFPKYYPELSSSRIITMDWIDGVHLSEFIETSPSQEERDRIGQLLWNFYNYQIHELREAHADPHPGNFIITKDMNLGVIDFGCVKEIPEDFYQPYFDLMRDEAYNDEERFISSLYQLDLIRDSDSISDRTLLMNLFRTMTALIYRPMKGGVFDFGDTAFFEELISTGESMSKDSRLRKLSGARGNKHAIYVNRTFYGLFNLLHLLKAKVDTSQYWKTST